jgi:hypothetical protein
MPGRYADQLYYHLGIPPVLIGHHDFCPFDQISYRLASAVCFHLLMLVVDPNEDIIMIMMMKK